jgi:hypothetical protein
MVIQLTFSGCESFGGQESWPARGSRHRGEFARQLTHRLLLKPDFYRGKGEDAKNLTVVKNFLYECQGYFYTPVQGASPVRMDSRMVGE